MLLKKPLPANVSGFHNHPLYILPRHLLKYQAIFPKNAKPITHFRQEPVYSRDNLVNLHSRQTWLKYARTVKPFEKEYKIVKGRLKRVNFNDIYFRNK
jgi:xeroderma pigmentosum group C-complementing protein